MRTLRFAGFVMSVLLPGTLVAQQRMQSALAAPVIAGDSLPEVRTIVQAARQRTPLYAPLASLAVPGTGQLLLGQQRGVAYAVLDAYLVLQALSSQRAGNRERAAYRQLAADIARAPFGSSRPEGAWAYYEAMEQFLESGRFDITPGGAVEPETDPSTYNGVQWQLARETFWQDPDTPPDPNSPEYGRALAFYEQRAIRDEFRWSWRDAQLVQDVYRQTITRANRNYQRAVNMVGLVAANHLLSMVDAFVTVRVRRHTAGSPLDGTEIHSGLGYLETRGGMHVVPTLRVAVPLGRAQRH